MAKTVFENEEAKVEIKVKQIVRTLAPVAGSDQWAIQDVDAYVSSWIDKGYKLISTHFAGSDGHGGWHMIYVLIKD